MGKPDYKNISFGFEIQTLISIVFQVEFKNVVIYGRKIGYGFRMESWVSLSVKFTDLGMNFESIHL